MFRGLDAPPARPGPGAGRRCGRSFPSTPFGEEGILVDAVVPADRPVPSEPDVKLAGWRILAQPEPRVLADGGRGSSDALAAAARIARAIGATLRVLGVARDAQAVDTLTAALTERPRRSRRPARRSACGRASATSRSSRSSPRPSTTSSSSTLGTKAGDRRRGGSVEPTTLERSRTPVLFARGPARPLKSLLICTAVGEPGRVAVRYGAWLAARLKARVLLLHVSRPGEEAAPWVRAHLERGVRTLHGLGVQADFLVRPARTPLEGILAEATQGGHDLVVIGRHVSPAGSHQGGDDVTLQVLRASDRPVLVVPENA